MPKKTQRSLIALIYNITRKHLLAGSQGFLLAFASKHFIVAILLSPSYSTSLTGV